MGIIRTRSSGKEAVEESNALEARLCCSEGSLDASASCRSLESETKHAVAAHSLMVLLLLFFLLLFFLFFLVQACEELLARLCSRIFLQLLPFDFCLMSDEFSPILSLPTSLLAFRRSLSQGRSRTYMNTLSRNPPRPQHHPRSSLCLCSSSLHLLHPIEPAASRWSLQHKPL